MDTREKQIFYSTDFAAQLKLDSYGYTSPFEFMFWTERRSRSFIARYDGTDYTNCALNDDGTLTIYFDHANLGLGEMTMQRKYSTASTAYSDSSYDQVLQPERATFTDADGDYVIKLDITTGETTPEPEEQATLSAPTSVSISAAGGEATIQVSSTKDGDEISIKTDPSAEWLTIESLGNNTFRVAAVKTTDFSGRTATYTFMNSQGVTVDVAVNQLAAVVSSYGEWALTLNNDKTYDIDYNAKSIALSATASRTDTYNNNLTKEVSGTVKWTSNAAWATIVGTTLSIAKCQGVSSTRSATITATVASVGGNEEKTATFTVNQTVMPQIVASPASLTSISADGDTKTVTLTTYGAVGTLTATSSDTSVATVSLSGSTLTVVVSAHETLSTRSCTITVSDANGNAADITINVSQVAATLYLFYGASLGVPTAIDTTNKTKLVNNASATITTVTSDKKKCHWVAAKTSTGYTVKTWKDVDGEDLLGMGSIDSTTVGEYTLYYYLGAGYVGNTSNVVVSV